MTVDDFAELTHHRIPTPAEFLAFVRSQDGWRVRVKPDGSAALSVPNTKDPLAVSFARMLGREPWRTEVLKLVAGLDAPPGPPAGNAPAPAPATTEGRETCPLCMKPPASPCDPGRRPKEYAMRDPAGNYTRVADPPCPSRTT